MVSLFKVQTEREFMADDIPAMCRGFSKFEIYKLIEQGFADINEFLDNMNSLYGMILVASLKL